jgi:hypothetical protein
VKLTCPNCGVVISAEQLFEVCRKSSTEASALIIECSQCSNKSAFLVENGRITSAGAGVRTEVPGLQARAYENYVHVWLGSKHWTYEDHRGVRQTSNKLLERTPDE